MIIIQKAGEIFPPAFFFFEFTRVASLSPLGFIMTQSPAASVDH